MIKFSDGDVIYWQETAQKNENGNENIHSFIFNSLHIKNTMTELNNIVMSVKQMYGETS